MTRTGWTIGTGWEWMMWQNWSAKVEYDFLDFGTKRESDNATYLVGTGLNPLIRDVDLHVNVVKFGLNYHFNGLR